MRNDLALRVWIDAHSQDMIPRAKPAGKLYSVDMRITEELRREIRRQLASAGGKARAAKYDKKTLSKWAKKGGRPPKTEGVR